MSKSQIKRNSIFTLMYRRWFIKDIIHDSHYGVATCSCITECLLHSASTCTGSMVWQRWWWCMVKALAAIFDLLPGPHQSKNGWAEPGREEGQILPLGAYSLEVNKPLEATFRPLHTIKAINFN